MLLQMTKVNPFDGHVPFHCTSLVAQLVKNPPEMQKTPVRFLDQEICWRRDRLPIPVFLGFPGSSTGKESTCNAGDTSWIPELGISSGKGIGYPLPYSWASLVAQMVKNLPAMQETWVQSLGWGDPLEESMVIRTSILAWRIPMDRGAGGLQSMGLQKVGHD